MKPKPSLQNYGRPAAAAAWMILSALLLSACTTLVGGDPSLTGTDSLISQIEEESGYFAKMAAAKELGHRFLTNRQIDRLLGFIESEVPPQIRIQIIDSLALRVAQREDIDLNRHVRDTLHDDIPGISDEEVCHAAYRFLMDLTEDREEMLGYVLEFMQANRHAKVRYWTLRYLIENGLEEEGTGRDEVLIAIYRTLERENIAAVAELPGRELGRRIYRPSLQTLEDISNSGDERKFEAANYDTQQGRVTHADVIATSILYAEGIRFATSDY
jgi:hypothetical protein